jgi:hypothetical protein
MRQFMLAGALAAAAMLPASIAEAYEGPWCLQANKGRSVSQICHFRTFEACAQERVLYGTTSFCGQNPRFLPYWQGRGFGGDQPVKVAHKNKKKHRH